jgi:SAM-dependent methyltransferase
MVYVTSTERDVIFDAVQAMYTAVASRPHGEFHFPVGRRACEYVGYPAEQLAALPVEAVESFAGVGYPFAAAVIRPGDVVLDIGSGSGTDVLIAAGLVGSRGTVWGLDMTGAMREKLAATALRAGVLNVHVLAGNAEAIPLPDRSVSVVTSNGVINLVPDKKAAVREIARVLGPGGRVQLADIVVDTLPSAACRAKPELWAECIVGATSERITLSSSGPWGSRPRCCRGSTTLRRAGVRRRARWRGRSARMRWCCGRSRAADSTPGG